MSVATHQPGKPYEKVVHVKTFVVYGYLPCNNKTSLFGVTQGAEEDSYYFYLDMVLNIDTR